MAEQDRKQSHPGELLVAGAVGITSALVAAVTTVRAKFYESVQHLPEVQKINADVQHAATAAERVYAVSEHTKADRDTMLRDVVKAKQGGEEAFAKAMEKLGYRSHGVLRGWGMGSIDRLRSLSETAWNGLIINTAIAAGIAAGGVMMFFNSNRMRERLDDMSDRLDQQAGTQR